MSSGRRERLRFDRFEFERFANGRCRATVVLDGVRGEQFAGRADGILTREGALRCSADAAVNAVQAAAPGRLRLQVVGVKAVRAFDATVVIVCLRSAEEDRHARRLGAYLAMDDPVRGAAIAVLNATNRMLGNVISVP